MSYFLATQPQSTTQQMRMHPRYWTAAAARPAAAAALSGLNQLALYVSLRAKNSLATLSYAVADTISHPLLRYTDTANYTGCVLSFGYSISASLPALNDPTNPPALLITLNDNSVHTVPLWNYAVPGSQPRSGSVSINFSTVQDSTSAPIDCTQIKTLAFQVVPGGYSSGSSAPLAAAIDGALILSSFTLSGASAQMPVGVYQTTNARVRLSLNYDTIAELTPERVANEMIALGYAQVETTMVWGALARLDLQWFDANQAFQVAAPFNFAAAAWAQNFCQLLTSGYSGPNGSVQNIKIIHGFSLELSDQWTNPVWTQRDSYGNPAKTNAADPNANFVGAFFNADFYAFLQASFTDALAFMPVGAPLEVCFDRFAWWYNTQFIGNAPAGSQPPCFYDDAAEAAYLAQFGQSAPVITDINASLSSAQQAYLSWLSQQLGALTAQLAAGVRLSYPGVAIAARIDVTRIINGSIMQAVNLPTAAWRSAVFACVQMADFAWVAPTTQAQHAVALSTATSTLGYGLSASTLVVGQAASAADWGPIDAAIEQAEAQGWGQVYGYNFALVAQFGYTHYEPASAPAVASTGTGSPFDFKSRLVRMYPNRWTTQRALNTSGPSATNGRLGALFMGLGYALSLSFGQLMYAKNQTRWKTRSDSNLDQSNADVLGTLWPRFSGELDFPFSARTVAWITTFGPTQQGLTNAVNAYLAALANTLTFQGPVGLDSAGALDTAGSLDQPVFQPVGAPQQLQGLDTQGALDTYGALDRALGTGNGPQVIVFDATNNPGLAAMISPVIADPEFCIYFRFPGLPDSNIHPIAPYSQALAAVIAAIKAEGTEVVWASNLT